MTFSITDIWFDYEICNYTVTKRFTDKTTVISVVFWCYASQAHHCDFPFKTIEKLAKVSLPSPEQDEKFIDFNDLTEEQTIVWIEKHSDIQQKIYQKLLKKYQQRYES